MHARALNALSAWITLGVDAAQRAVAEAVELPERGVAALVLIDSHPSCSVDWLYHRLGITQSGTVRLLDRLQSSELITRGRRAGQREVEVMITAAGRRVLARGIAARSHALTDLIAPLTDRERDQLTRLIDKALSGNSRPRARADTACRLCDWNACAEACPVDTSVPLADDAG
jgi:DNA-binding MarR family transcriptional regulator